MRSELFAVSGSVAERHKISLQDAKTESEISLAFSGVVPVTYRTQVVKKSWSHHDCGTAIALFRGRVPTAQRRRQSGEPMEKQWFCVSCISQIELDTHGRCSTCGSDAVERITRGAFLMIQQEDARGYPSSHNGPALPTR